MLYGTGSSERPWIGIVEFQAWHPEQFPLAGDSVNLPDGGVKLN